jgi:hypothetical protein
MDSSDQSQQAADEAVTPSPAPPDDDQTVAMASGVFPPPYAPPSPFPPTIAMSQPVAPTQSAPGRMVRSQALDVISRLKATLVAGSVIAFGVFAGLAAAHVTGVTARSGAAAQSGAAQNAQATPTPSRHDDDGGFFSSSPPNGFGVGAPSQQGPASSTSVS